MIAAMAAEELCKGEISFRLANGILIQVFIARQKADHLDESTAGERGDSS
jgi:hypothetical protein